MYNSVSFDATVCKLNYAMTEAIAVAISYGLINISQFPLVFFFRKIVHRVDNLLIEMAYKERCNCF